jgi:putative transposase
MVAGRGLDDQLTLAAPRMVLSSRRPQAGLVHHSDRGSQYASHEYTELLKANQIAASMSRRGNPWGQRPLRILHENAEVRGSLPQRILRLGRGPRLIGEFLDQVYNHKRLHSAGILAS